MSAPRPTVAVVGGGVVGASIAWRCARDGCRVVLFEPDPAASAAHAAAGMLWSATEPGRSVRMLEARRHAAARWPAFARELAADAGVDPGFVSSGTLSVAMSDEQVARLQVEHDHLVDRGIVARWLGRSELRGAEPSLAEHVVAGMLVPGDHQVSPPRLLAALAGAAQQAGVEIVGEYLDRGGLASLDTDVVVVAAGWRIGELVDDVPVRPVKGQTVWLRPVAGRPSPSRVFRAEGVYIAARPDEIVIGATVEDVGADLTARSGPVASLLGAAIEVVPGLADAEIDRCGVGLRPCTPDEEPVLGWIDDRTIVAGGHHRNGILFAPATADAVLDLVHGAPLPDAMAGFSPERFG